MVLPAARAFAFEPGGVQASPVAFVHRGASFALNFAFHPDPVSCLIQSSEMFGAGVRATVMADARKFNQSSKIAKIGHFDFPLCAGWWGPEPPVG
jgi:hypothetical protein